METTARKDIKITYSTMSADQMDDLHRAIDEEIPRVRGTFGKSWPMYVNGQPVKSDKEFEDRSPTDTRILIAKLQSGTKDHVRQAVAAARAAFPAWAALPWQERVRLVRKAADTIRDHRWELSVVMGFEAGKNRLECVGDVEESADLMSYYCDQVEHNQGFVKPMNTLGPGEDNRSVLRPYGVWAVISPFNFPMALAAGPSGGALVAGNTVVFKPASDTAYMGLRLAEIMNEAGIPKGVFNFVTGGGGTCGQELIDNDGIDGLVFTASYDVGMKLIRDNATRRAPRPGITEMGAKIRAIVMRVADHDKATD